MSERAFRINQAVRECLERCYSTHSALNTVAEFLHELRADPEWRESDVHEVETTVHRMITVIVSRSDLDR